MIKNLSQLKKAIKEGNKFVIRKHYIKPKYEGQIRYPHIVQTNGFYSVEDNKPNSEITLSNNGKGNWMEFGKASDWKFENGLCICTDVWEIEFI